MNQCFWKEKVLMVNYYPLSEAAQAECKGPWIAEDTEVPLRDMGPQYTDDLYKLSVEDLASNREAVEASDMDIMEKLLDQIGDKHFYIFTYHSKNHLELMQMQMEKVMDFGMDIQHIENDHVYIFIMDKKVTSGAFQI